MADKTFSNRSNAKRAIVNFRDKHPDLTGVELTLFAVGDKVGVSATGWENSQVAAIDAAGFVRIESEEAGVDEALNIDLSGAKPPAEEPESEAAPYTIVEKEWVVDADVSEADTLVDAETVKAGFFADLEKAITDLENAVSEAKATNASSKPAKVTKNTEALAMLRRPEGATVAEMMLTFGWLAHTTRAWISAAVGKKLGLTVKREKVEGRGSVYKIVE
jgi:Protein of unknown function (DUF3489)